MYCGKWGLDHIGYGAMPWSLVSGGEIYFDDRVRIRNAVMACLPTGKKELMCFSSLSIDMIRVPDFHALVVKLFSYSTHLHAPSHGATRSSCNAAKQTCLQFLGTVPMTSASFNDSTGARQHRMLDLLTIHSRAESPVQIQDRKGTNLIRSSNKLIVRFPTRLLHSNIPNPSDILQTNDAHQIPLPK